MRGDTAARTSHCKDMFMIGAYSDNDVREYQGLNPIPGGDRYFIPLNMMPIDQLDDTPNADTLDEDGKPIQRAISPGQALAAVGRIRQAHERFFRDAVGRIVHRKPGERSNYAESALISPILSLIEGLFDEISAENKLFASSFAREIGIDAPNWAAENADMIAGYQLDRTIRTLLPRKAN
jgi:hypothetical protein